MLFRPKWRYERVYACVPTILGRNSEQTDAIEFRLWSHLIQHVPAFRLFRLEKYLKNAKKTLFLDVPTSPFDLKEHAQMTSGKVDFFSKFTSLVLDKGCGCTENRQQKWTMPVFLRPVCLFCLCMRNLRVVPLARQGELRL